MWRLGPRHRLLVGDATVPGDVGRLLDGVKPDMILTDPPYCSGGFQESGRSAGSIGRREQRDDAGARIRPRIANDTLSTRGYTALMKSVLTLAGASLAYVFTDWRMWVNLFDVVESSGYGARNMIVWNKGSPGMGAGWRTQHELIMYAAKASVKFDNHKAVGNVVTLSRTRNELHPTQKPVELLTVILDITDMAQTVYDPFGGSGTTLIACEQAGRTAYLMELDPVHADTTLRRFERTAGITPERVRPDGTTEPVSFT